MLTWFLTSMIIAGASMAALELFRERNGSDGLVRGSDGSGPADGDSEAAVRPILTWESMSEADLDFLVEEFSVAGGEWPGLMKRWNGSRLC